MNNFASAVSVVTSLALAVSYPISHPSRTCWQFLLPRSTPSHKQRRSRSISEDPSKFAVAAASPRGAPAAAKEKEKKLEPEEVPLYDCTLLLKPHVRKVSLMDLAARVSEQVYRKNGVITDMKSFGAVQLGYGTKKLDGK
ncbi:hypothetical protein D8674_042942 [Pyrus ussuriensis x Pyrus communis]|uniref:Uncharacterized protein n=1 Tax=Pyrus ussuriensis x Pyrus communis TaxID=2448454 RepID=A0A5N5I0L5_9ROSA|nr:hypothetical protein D8674_037522 [Pyrus ussuriensis x Pyrus communis]KAB2631942.1 hypothetical protein D8674_042942 [Pyrus ussuriensis x Pyrus communis]